MNAADLKRLEGIKILDSNLNGREKWLVAQVDDLLRDFEAAEAAIRWALGEEGDFAFRPEGAGAYWWRTELRQRASLFPQEPQEKGASRE